MNEKVCKKMEEWNGRIEEPNGRIEEHEQTNDEGCE